MALSLFSGFGIELEYMIVDRESLAVRPIADELIKKVAGSYVSDVERGDIAWSNELVNHVIELKTNGPAPKLEGLAAKFQDEVGTINEILAKWDAMLMPTAAHPLMDPATETFLWSHEYNAVYEAYNRIFDCRGHGWSNLQSMHINLPFANDEEFGRLHAAIRMLMPLMPALAASSPVIDGKLTGDMDTRMRYYMTNSSKIPSIAGHIIPEPVFTRKDYEEQILQKSYDDIAPYDTDGILQDEFLNSRGAIARFSRGAIEIRVLDLQECPGADLAVARLIIETLRLLTEGKPIPVEEQMKWATAPLRRIFLECVHAADQAPIKNAEYAEVFSLRDEVGGDPPRASQLWGDIVQRLAGHQLYTTLGQVPESFGETAAHLSTIISDGPLARRISRMLEMGSSPKMIKDVYRELCSCLAEGRSFLDY